jgi:nicotinamide mononucleotide transporter
MKSIRTYIKEEFLGWKPWEVIWLITACAIILAVSIYWKDSVMGMVSAITGVACVVCTGKGKLSAYLFGAVNTLLYAVISYKARFYGEVMLNALYYFPMQFYGIYVWSRHMNEETHEVEKQEMQPGRKMLLLTAVAAATVAYGFLLKVLGGTLPYVDALSTVVSVAAMILSVRMYAEQWILWIIVDVVTVIMWGFAFLKGNDSIATLVMWMVYLVNAVLMYVKWTKEAKRNAV